MKAPSRAFGSAPIFFAFLFVALAATFAGASGANAGVSARAVCGPVPVGYARCFALTLNGSAAPLASAPSGYGPADLQAAYKLPSATAGAGQTVAIVDAFDDPTA